MIWSRTFARPSSWTSTVFIDSRYVTGYLACVWAAVLSTLCASVNQNQGWGRHIHTQFSSQRDGVHQVPSFHIEKGGL
jgi:hypothetical protein